MQARRKSLKTLRQIADVIVIIFSFLIAAIISYEYNKVMLRFQNISLLIIVIGLWSIFSKNFRLYDEFRSRNFAIEASILFKVVLSLSISTIVFLFISKDDGYSRFFVTIFSIIVLLFLLIERAMFRRILKYLRSNGKNIRNILVVGAGAVGEKLLYTIKENPNFGYRIYGFLDDEKKSFLNGNYLGKIENLDNILRDNIIDDVIIALPNYAMETIEGVVRICEQHNSRVRIIPDYFKVLKGKYDISMFGRFPIISVKDDKVNEFICRFAKRVLDLVITLISFLFLFSWIFPIISIFIKISSNGPIFFVQERWGRDNKRFKAIKFRSMVVESKDTDRTGKYQQATKNDPRITKIGAFLRKTNLDELPQFINVLIGDMSLVGPRPHPGPLNEESRDKVKQYMLRNLVKPGITGWAQINGYRGETKDLKLMEKRVEFDIWYIENWSIWLDIQIIYLTLWNMIKGDPNAY